MTLGDGILWSTVLILLASGIYLLSIKKKWKSFGKVVGVIILIGAIIGGGIWGYFKYQDRPQMTTMLGGIKLDMKPVEVSLKLGEPSRKIEGIEPNPDKPGSEHSAVWVYSAEYDGGEGVVGVSYGPDPESLTTAVICQYNGPDKVVGVGRYTSEENVIARLGEPKNVSINEDGIRKYISYEQWLASYEITKGKVSGVCLSSSGRVKYGVEYGEETEEE